MNIALVWAALMLVIVSIVVWNTTKLFGWLSPLRIVKRHDIVTNAGILLIRRVTFRKGHVRSLSVSIPAIKDEYHVYAPRRAMEELKKLQLPLGMDIVSRDEDGFWVLRCGCSPMQNELHHVEFAPFDRFTELAICPMGMVSRPREVSPAYVDKKLASQ